MASSVAARGKAGRPIEINEDDNSVDEEQLEEYSEEVEDLGSFPDKVKINSLSIIAGDHAESRASANAIYQIIRKRLLSTTRDNMLPLVYLLDSILKNVKGFYIDLVQEDAENWMPTVHQKLQDVQRAKLKKVWNTWEEFKIFSTDSWKAMGRCFDSQLSNGNSVVGSTLSNVAGIARTPDGNLILSATMRAEMQNILDELQKDLTNELDKVSLERLSDINPDLLANIKKAAEDNIQNVGTPAGGLASKETGGDDTESVYFTETRSVEAVERANAWNDLKWDPLTKTHDIVSKLQHAVREGTSSSTALYTQKEASEMTKFYAAASATCSIVTAALEELKNEQDRKQHKKRLSFPGSGSSMGTGFLVDKKDFTNEGIKSKNPTVIGLLYEIGLPFLSSADGRRFRTEIELSNHLDALFKRNQLEKSMARTEERGWYSTADKWTGEAKESDVVSAAVEAGNTPDAATDDFDPETSMVPADESRDRCVICGINFKMFFDNENGIYMYSNCREIDVLNDDAAERDSEEKLVHVTCWRGLGSPEVLTMDQALQDTLRQ